MLHTLTRGLIMQKACGHAACTALPQFVSAQFQVLFHSPHGVLFAFPSRYLFTIGHQLVFSLRGWALQIRARFHVSRSTWDTARAHSDFAYVAVTRYGRSFQSVRLSSCVSRYGPATLQRKRRSLGCSQIGRAHVCTPVTPIYRM